MKIKLQDSEYKVLEILWAQGDTTAKELSLALQKSTGWSKTTSYTVIKRSIDKGLIQRKNPNFLCHALISKTDAQLNETSLLIDRLYEGSPKLLLSFLVNQGSITQKEIDDLNNLLNDFKE